MDMSPHHPENFKEIIQKYFDRAYQQCYLRGIEPTHENLFVLILKYWQEETSA
jgi:hypothetical protein